MAPLSPASSPSRSRQPSILGQSYFSLLSISSFPCCLPLCSFPACCLSQEAACPVFTTPVRSLALCFSIGSGNAEQHRQKTGEEEIGRFRCAFPSHHHPTARRSHHLSVSSHERPQLWSDHPLPPAFSPKPCTPGNGNSPASIRGGLPLFLVASLIIDIKLTPNYSIANGVLLEL